MKPIILITAGTSQIKEKGTCIVLYENYAECIRRAGGIPVIISGEYTENLEQLSEMTAGLVLTGGGDFAPSCYPEEKNLPEYDYDVVRDCMEFELCRLFMEKKKPILGICRGFQLINLVCGGSLYQDIKTNLGAEHSSDGRLHKVRTVSGSWWDREYGSEFSVNSYHHQAVHMLGRELIPSVFDKDSGIIEAFEHESLPVMGVQWHPERMMGKSFYTQNVSNMNKYVDKFLLHVDNYLAFTKTI